MQSSKDWLIENKDFKIKTDFSSYSNVGIPPARLKDKSGKKRKSGQPSLSKDLIDRSNRSTPTVDEKPIVENHAGISVAVMMETDPPALKPDPDEDELVRVKKGF